MERSNGRFTGQYRCQGRRSSNKVASLGITLGLLTGIMLISNVAAPAQECSSHSKLKAGGSQYSAVKEATHPYTNFQNELKLSAEQSGKLDAIHQNLHKKMGQISHEMTAKRAELKQLLTTENPDPDRSRLLAEQLGELQGKAQTARINARIDAQQVLTPAQRAKISVLVGKKECDTSLAAGNEPKSSLKQLLCQSGECPSSVAGKQAKPYASAVKVAKTMDPVCGKRVETTGSVYSSYNGKEYHFCCPECQQSFAKNPKEYTK